MLSWILLFLGLAPALFTREQTVLKMSTMRAVILGGSGNVGSRVVAECVRNEAFTSVTLLSRRPLPEYDDASTHGNKVKVQVVKSFDDLETRVDLTNHNVAFMLMGIGKPSNSTKEELEKVDCTIPVAFAAACKKGGVDHISVLSSVGADESQDWSMITRTTAGGGWYSRMKGLMENRVGALAFKSVCVVRPAMIYPGNSNSPSLLGQLNQSLNWLLPSVFNSVGSTEIAQAMVRTMQDQVAGDVTGVKVIEGGGDIRKASVDSN